MTLNEYFDQIICINLARREDRWAECEKQFKAFGIYAKRFEAHDVPEQGNFGCTASHRGVLELICHHRWPRTLILEDDFEFIFPDMQARFGQTVDLVPGNWDMLYLGGHYAENPQQRINANVIRIGRMLTTSSYAITYQAARKMAPHIYGVGPIDNLYFPFHENLNCYILQPRLCVQRTGYSDLAGEVRNHSICMQDGSHENTV